MNVTVFGASGHVGRLVVKQLLTSGYGVTAFVHGANPFSNDNRLIVVQGDIHSSDDIEQALDGAEAIISCLGSWHTPTKDILTSAMKSIIPIAERNNIKRIISLTGAAAIAPGDSLRFIDKLNHYALHVVAPKILGDGEEHIRLLSGSNLDWTVIRSPIMINKKDAKYQLNTCTLSPFATISRIAVATAAVDLIKKNPHVGTAPYIHH